MNTRRFAVWIYSSSEYSVHICHDRTRVQCGRAVSAVDASWQLYALWHSRLWFCSYSSVVDVASTGIRAFSSSYSTLASRGPSTRNTTKQSVFDTIQPT